MTNLILVFLCLLPFSALIINKVDIWHGQGYYAQGAVLIIYCYHLFKKCRPLSVLFGWVGLFTLFQFVCVQIQTQQYAVKLFLPFFNFICIVILFDVLTTYCNKDFYTRFIKYFSVSFLIVLAYCLIQKLGLDQFYRIIGRSQEVNNNQVVGIIGNPMHNAHFIAICLPILFILKGWVRKLAIFFALLMITFTGTSTGLITSVIVLIFAQVFLKIFSKKEIILYSIIGISLVILKYPFFLTKIHQFFQPDYNFEKVGRWMRWKDYYPIFLQKPITGWGLGFINEMAKTPQFLNWRHVHFEYYHFAIETGLIGVGLAFWGIIDYFRRFKSVAKDETTVIMASMFLAFLLTSFSGYPMHLWVTSVLGITSYSFMYIRSK
ncbi:MAG: O-antigen ligase family protein [Planctomycetota bacterium]